MSNYATATPPAAGGPLGAPASAYTWPELIKRWQHDQLTLEQAIGQLLLWGQHAHAEATACRRAQEKLARQVAELETQISAQGGAMP